MDEQVIELGILRRRLLDGVGRFGRHGFGKEEELAGKGLLDLSQQIHDPLPAVAADLV